MRDDRILLIRTGGNIDAAPYDLSKPPLNIETLKGEDSLVGQTIEKMPNHQNVDIYDWGKLEDRFVKDSKFFTDSDMEYLADLIKNDDHKYFIMTHGNDWIIRNPKRLGELLEGSGKTVVFVAAMIPLSVRPKTSDVIELLRYTVDNITDPDQKPGVFLAAYDAHTKRARFFDTKKELEKDYYASLDKEHGGENQKLLFRER